MKISDDVFGAYPVRRALGLFYVVLPLRWWLSQYIGEEGMRNGFAQIFSPSYCCCSNLFGGLWWRFPLLCLGPTCEIGAAGDHLLRAYQVRWLPQCSPRRAGNLSHLSLRCGFQISVFPLDTFCPVLCAPLAYLSVSARVIILFYFSGLDVLWLKSVDIHLIEFFFLAGSRLCTCVNATFCKRTSEFPSMHWKIFIADL